MPRSLQFASRCRRVSGRARRIVHPLKKKGGWRTSRPCSQPEQKGCPKLSCELPRHNPVQYRNGVPGNLLVKRKPRQCPTAALRADAKGDPSADASSRMNLSLPDCRKQDGPGRDIAGNLGRNSLVGRWIKVEGHVTAESFWGSPAAAGEQQFTGSHPFQPVQSARPDLCFVPAMIKSVAGKETRDKNDFYTSTLAPVDHQGKIRIRPLDIVILTVLFLEMAVLMRFLLAK